MRYARKHKHNGITRHKGDKYEGDVNPARFLYHRGILEPDGDPIDHLVTGPKPTQQDWDAFNAPESEA